MGFLNKDYAISIMSLANKIPHLKARKVLEIQ